VKYDLCGEKREYVNVEVEVEDGARNRTGANEMIVWGTSRAQTYQRW
jgi:hypothetical protein